MNFKQDRALLSAFGQGTCLSELGAHCLTAIIQVALSELKPKGIVAQACSSLRPAG